MTLQPYYSDPNLGLKQSMPKANQKIGWKKDGYELKGKHLTLQFPELN